jgi:hypothetical protein
MFASPVEATLYAWYGCHVIGTWHMLTSHNVITVSIKRMYEQLWCTHEQSESLHNIINKHYNLILAEIGFFSSCIPIYNYLSAQIGGMPGAKVLVLVVDLVGLYICMAVPLVVQLSATNMHKFEVVGLACPIKSFCGHKPRLMGIDIYWGVKPVHIYKHLLKRCNTTLNHRLLLLIWIWGVLPFRNHYIRWPRLLLP